MRNYTFMDENAMQSLKIVYQIIFVLIRWKLFLIDFPKMFSIAQHSRVKGKKEIV